MREREVVRESEPVAEREVVVDDRPRRGGGGGVIAVVVGVVLLLILAWFLLQALNIFGDAAEEGVEVNPPDANVEIEG